MSDAAALERWRELSHLRARIPTATSGRIFVGSIPITELELLCRPCVAGMGIMSLHFRL
jgi:hypothetical protein